MMKGKKPFGFESRHGLDFWSVGTWLRIRKKESRLKGGICL